MNSEVAAVKVGSRHGSVIPVLAENPNHPEEQSAVVMCGQRLKTNLSSPAPTHVPLTNTRDRQTDREDEARPESSEDEPERLCQNLCNTGRHHIVGKVMRQRLITNQKLGLFCK